MKRMGKKLKFRLGGVGNERGEGSEVFKEEEIMFLEVGEDIGGNCGSQGGK